MIFLVFEDDYDPVLSITGTLKAGGYDGLVELIRHAQETAKGYKLIPLSDADLSPLERAAKRILRYYREKKEYDNRQKEPHVAGKQDIPPVHPEDEWWEELKRRS